MICLGVDSRLIFSLAVTDCSAVLLNHSVPKLGAASAAVLLAWMVCLGTYFLESHAKKGYGWAFAAGMTIYALDLLFWIRLGNWVEVAAHTFVLYQLARGLSACMRKEALEQAKSFETISWWK
jgi:hypothetical protein